MNSTMVSHYRNYDTTQANKISIQISFESTFEFGKSFEHHR